MFALSGSPRASSQGQREVLLVSIEWYPVIKKQEPLLPNGHDVAILGK